MNSFIPWVGGKGKLLWIINKMAPERYSRFIDVFGGSGTVTMNRPTRKGCMEVYQPVLLCEKPHACAAFRIGFLAVEYAG